MALKTIDLVKMTYKSGISENEFFWLNFGIMVFRQEADLGYSRNVEL